MFKSQLIKSNTESEAKHRVDTYGATVFSPDFSSTIIVDKLCRNQQEPPIQIRLLCMPHSPNNIRIP